MRFMRQAVYFVWLLRSWLFGRPQVWFVVNVSELPDSLEAEHLYAVGEDGVNWFVAMRCPCGCGETLQMSLHREGRPRWRLITHLDGTATLLPSVWRRTGCRSHFFLRRGRIRWC